MSLKFSDFCQEMFADSLWHGNQVLHIPKPDKNDASNGLILGHEELQKCSNFYQAWIGLKNLVVRRFDPHIPIDGFLGSLGHQNSSLREAQPVYYFSMVFN